jgi:hypothetical protein
VLGFDPLIELRGSWYTFQEGISRSYVPATGTYGETETIALFPSTTGTGITGELAWWRMDNATLGPNAGAVTEPKTELELRREMLEQHDRFVQALADADTGALLSTLSEGVQSAVRDLVDDTGTLVGLDGLEEHRRHYEQLFERYEVRSVELLSRVVQPWYLFAELRWTVSPRLGSDAGSTVAFHTAEFLVPAADGRFIARIGHATDPATITPA